MDETIDERTLDAPICNIEHRCNMRFCSLSKLLISFYQTTKPYTLIQREIYMMLL